MLITDNWNITVLHICLWPSNQRLVAPVKAHLAWSPTHSFLGLAVSSASATCRCLHCCLYASIATWIMVFALPVHLPFSPCCYYKNTCFKIFIFSLWHHEMLPALVKIKLMVALNVHLLNYCMHPWKLVYTW